MSIDAMGRVKTIVACAVPPRRFTDATILVPQTGVPMTSGTARFRLPMTEWCLRLQRFEQLQGYSGPFDITELPDHDNRCIFCAACAENEIQQQDAVDDVRFVVCRQCMRPWHIQCAESLCYRDDFVAVFVSDDEGFICAPCVAISQAAAA